MSIVDTIFRVRKQRTGTDTNYGTAIPQLLRGLEEEPADRGEFHERFMEGVERTNAPAQDDPVARDGSEQEQGVLAAEAETRVGAAEADEVVDESAGDAAPGEPAADLTDDEIHALADAEDAREAELADEVAAEAEADDAETAAGDEAPVLEADAARDTAADEPAAPLFEPAPARTVALVPQAPQMTEYEAFRSIATRLEDELQTFAEAVALSKLTFSSMQPFFQRFEADRQMAREIERERDGLNADVADMKKAKEGLQRDLAIKLASLDAATRRNSELRAELDQRRQANQDFVAKLDRLRKEQEKLTSDLGSARAENVRLSAALEREAAEKEAHYQSRVEMSGRYAKLQQAEAQARTKYLELSVQHEKFAKSQPQLIAEQEKLRNELRIAQRDKADTQNRLLAAQDQIAQLESEVQSLQSHSASEAYAARTELEMHKSAMRSSEKAITEAEIRNKELHKQLRETEAAKATAEGQNAILQEELENVRKERADAAFKLSDVNLKYMTDLLSLDQQREQNKEFQYDIDALLAEKRRMAKYESLYKAAESQIVSLKEKLGLLAENLRDDADPEKLRQSLQIISELGESTLSEAEEPAPKPRGSKPPVAH